MANPRLPRWEEDPPDPVELEMARRGRRKLFVGFLVLLFLGMLVYWRFVVESPVDYEAIEQHFKYGSIGSEAGNGLPYWIWKVLPEVFPEYLPDGGKAGYESLGFVYEKGPDGKTNDTPIGFSKRRMQGIVRVGLNCSVCHTAALRESEAAERRVVLGMPAHQLDLLSYFKFIFDCAGDGRFTVENMMAEIDARANLDPVERTIYKIAIPRARQEILRLRGRASFMLEHPSGAGRIDTFTPYKAVQFNFTHTDDFSVGNADFPSIWNQQPREGMFLHWDGNNDSVFERNISAAIGAGATPVSLDLPRMQRVRDWIWTLPPPKYPWAIDQALAARGAPLYKQYCAECHGMPENQFKGGKVGTVVPIEMIGTDRERYDSYSLDLTQNQYTLGSGTSWRFTHFRKSNGYANMPLDGVWARGPYLHNGSVPTLRDLLDPPDKRPKSFYRGNDVYDPKKVGFVVDRPASNGRTLTPYDTKTRGNGNGGHTGKAYGVDLPDADKDALVEYLKTL
jgi:mono/diheme cytochrome c family protein